MNSLSKCSDNELYTLLKTGDRKAYTQIYIRYNSLLLNFAYKKTNNKEEAKDLLHEIFLTLWEKRGALDISKNLPSYLFFIMKNKTLDLYKRKKVSDRYIETFENFLDSYQTDTDYLLRHNDLSTLIESEISALPPKMREVFELSRKTHLSRKEIAQQLNLSERTVQSHMNHALTKLKKRLGSLSFLVLFIFP